MERARGPRAPRAVSGATRRARDRGSAPQATTLIDPLEAVIAILRSYPLDKRAGSVEIVFGAGGVPVHVHERRTTHLSGRADTAGKD